MDTNGTPAYQCLAYREQSPLWAYLDDVFTGIDAWTDRQPDGTLKPNSKSTHYLPRGTDDPDYDWRLKTTPFDDRFRAAATDFVQMISSNGVQLSEVSDQISEHLTNIDGIGTPIAAFTWSVAIAAMRRGHSFILVDYPPADESVITYADHLASGRRPHWVHLESPDVIDWVTVRHAGTEHLAQVTIRERVVKRKPFSEELTTQYRVLRPGSWEVWTVESDKQGKPVQTLTASGRSSLPYIPLVPVYGGLQTGFFRSRPPLRSLADLNLAHYQTRAEHRHKLKLCSFPQAVWKDSLSPRDASLRLGPQTIVRIQDPQGGFTWAEPNATSLAATRTEVQDLEAAMDLISAVYLINPGDRQSAAATFAQVVKLESSLGLFAADIQTGINRALAIHADYLGTTPGLLELSGDVIKDDGRDSQLLMALSQLPSGDLLSKRTYLEELRRRSYLNPRLDVDAEIARIGEEVKLREITVGKVEPAPNGSVLTK